MLYPAMFKGIVKLWIWNSICDAVWMDITNMSWYIQTGSIHHSNYSAPISPGSPDSVFQQTNQCPLPMMKSINQCPWYQRVIWHAGFYEKRPNQRDELSFYREGFKWGPRRKDSGRLFNRAGEQERNAFTPALISILRTDSGIPLCDLNEHSGNDVASTDCR